MNKASILVILFFVQASLAAPDSRGTDFFVAFAYNYQPGLGQTQDLFISADVAVQVEVSTHSGVITTVSVPAQTTVSVDVSSIYIPNENTVAFYGIRVRSLNPNVEFTLVGLNTYPATTDAFLAFPVDVLGTDYTVGSYIGCCSVPSYLYVVGTVDGTTVSISGGHSLDGLGNSVTYTIGRYGTVLVGSNNGDITGFRVQSSNPIAVFSGAACADIPVGVYACNVLVDQIPPTQTWANDFITVPIATRRAGDVFRVVSSQPGTLITLNGNNVATIGTGQYYEFQSAVPNVIHTSNPALVLQFDKGSSADGVSSDPFQIWIPPVPQFSSNYYISTPLSSVWTNWISLVVPSGQQSGINIDGHALSATWSNVQGASYVFTQVQIAAGSHHVYHTSPIVPFEIISYGFSYYDGYGYVGGNRLAPLQAPCTPTPTVPGDGIDNDCDGKIDEEIRNNIDDDGDGLIDEDLTQDTCCFSSTRNPTLTPSGSAASVTISCGSTVPTAPTVTAAVDCGSQSSFTVSPSVSTTGGSCPQDSTITRTWSVTDTCGRTATLTQVITVVDSTAPTVHSPSNANVQCGGDTSISALGSATASDNCDSNLATPTAHDVTSSGSCLPVITRTWSVSDHCGNTGSSVQTINIVDSQGPTVTAPSSLTLQCGSDSSQSATGSATVQDACFTSLTATASDSSSASSCLAVGSITRTFSATDGCGKSSSSQQTITFVDTVAPTVTAPSGTTVECGYDSSIATTGNAVASDLCSTTPLVVSHSDSFTPTSSTCPSTGVITRTFSSTDSCGNTGYGSQQITIRDTTKPNGVTDPLCIFPPNGLSACFSVSNPSYVHATDACSPSLTVAYQGCSNNNGNTEGCHFDSAHNQICLDAVNSASYSLPFSVTDCSGNSVTETATVTVPNRNNNCAGFTSCDAAITGVSPSVAVITQLDAYGYEYAPQYRIQVQITVQEAVLSNWRLEVHFPAPGEKLVRYSQYDVYTDGVFKCESFNPDYCVISPAAWAMTVNQGGLITVEYVATNNARLTPAQIRAGSTYYVWTTQ